MSRRLLALVSTCAVLAAAAIPTVPSAQGLDLDVIMPCAAPAFTGKQSPAECLKARDTLMQQCTSCHTVVPVARAQKAEQEWEATMVRHQERMPDSTPADIAAIAQFLKDHFRPDRPVPPIPQDLIDNDPGFPPA